MDFIIVLWGESMKKVNMLEGSLNSIFFFAVPIMLSSLLQYNYAIVDNIIVGRYVSQEALAAVGNVGSINSFIIGAALGLTSGFTIPVAQSFGAGDKKMVSRYAGSSISVAFSVGLALVVIAHLISDPMLRLIGTPEEIINLSSAYINILYYAIPIQMLSNNFTALSRSVGESRKPLIFFVISVLINFTLDIIFVKNLGWGVEGAAAATFISHFSVMLMTGIYVLKFNKDINITKKDLIPKPETSLKQLRLGIPVSLQFTITSIGSMCLQSAVNSFGTNVMAGFTAAGRVENLTNIPLSGLGVATQTFVSQNFGAKNYDRIIRSVKKILIIDIAVSAVMSTVLLLVGPSAVSLFMTKPNEAMMFAAKRYLLATAQCYSLVAILFVLRNSLQGLGYTYANATAGAGELIGRIVIALVLTPVIGFNAVCYAAPAAWLMADIPLFIIYLIKNKKFKKLAYEQASDKVIA